MAHFCLDRCVLAVVFDHRGYDSSCSCWSAKQRQEAVGLKGHVCWLQVFNWRALSATLLECVLCVVITTSQKDTCRLLQRMITGTFRPPPPVCSSSAPSRRSARHGSRLAKDRSSASSSIGCVRRVQASCSLHALHCMNISRPGILRGAPMLLHMSSGRKQGNLLILGSQQS